MAAAPKVFVNAERPVVSGVASQTSLPPDLSKFDAVLITSAAPADKDRIQAYLNNGGGVVLVGDAIIAAGFATGEVKKWDGVVPLFFTPPGRGNPITHGISNFDLDDEMFYGIDPAANATILATTWTPNRKHLKGTDPQPYVYGVSPMLWSQEAGKGRVVCYVPGKKAATLEHPAVRAMLARSLAWVAKGQDVDELVKKEDLQQLNYPPGGPLSPKASVESLKVHPDFTASLVAAEPLISKVMNLDWDAQGRLWVVESVEYPEGKQGGGPESMASVWQRETNLPKPPAVNRPAGDRVSWLEDTDHDGVMDRKHVFADNLDLATSFCFYRDSIIVAQPPEILLLSDTNHDGKADKREVLYKGLGTSDRHAVLNNLRWGLDGWIYATHGYAGAPDITSGDGQKHFGAIGSGIVRFKPDGSMIEMVSAKSGNCWGVDITSDGELFFTQPTSGDLVMHVPVSDRLMAEGGLGNQPSWQVMVHMRPVKPLMSWEEIVENQPNDIIGSFTAACGCAVYEGGSWPKEWTRGYFTAEPTVHIIHHEALTPDGPTFAANKTREEEFSATRDFWTRPIDTRVGPDGQLYVIDFYNQAILHNDPRGPIHLWNNQAARPDRDHYFGRIIRYQNKNSKPWPAVKLDTLANQVAALGHPNREVRFKAQRLIEEGDIKAAAAMLERPKGLAAIHALWIRAKAGVLTDAEMGAALGDPELEVRNTAAKVIAAHPELARPAVREALFQRLGKETDARVRLNLLVALPADSVVPPQTLVSCPAHDRWTLAAVARVARNNPSEVLAAALSWENGQNNKELVPMLFDSCAADAKKLVPVLRALQSPNGSDLAVAVLSSLQRRQLPSDPEVAAALNELAESPSASLAAAALPMAMKFWSAEKIAMDLPSRVEMITKAPDPNVLGALATLEAFPEFLSAKLSQGLAGKEAVRLGILKSLLENPSIDAAKLMIDALPSLSVADKSKAVEALLARPQSAMLLTDAFDSGKLTPAIAGTQVLSRLADHPDAAVKEHAKPVISRLRGAVEAKDVIIQRLLPEVMKPGDPAVGKQLFAACAVCHTFQGQGATIGPVLEGIGVHSVETLLTHIVDPNREVEPSYHTWNITSKDGKILTGYISRETAGSMFLKSAAGEMEIKRDDIASKVDTGKSLMPEGFEGLGAEPLRNLIAYLRSGDQRYHTITLGKAATADGSRGVFMAVDVAIDHVGFKKYGLVEERGVPFYVQDPAASADGHNIIVLKGGLDPRAVAKTMPQQVEIPVNLAAGRLHLLGAVAGWGFPAVQARDPLMKITVVYADKTTEELVFANGIDIADHIPGVEVPGSASTGLASNGQVRYLWRNLKKPTATIEKLVIASTNAAPAPMVAAITLESASKDGAMAPAPAQGGPVQPQ